LQRAAVTSEPLEALTEERLRRISADQGIDFATRLLFEAVSESPRHAEFLERLESPSDGPWADTPPTVVIVPGAFYREDKSSGADGQAVIDIVRQFGCPTARIPLESFGPLRRNAAIIRDWLRARPSGETVVMASLSKGGAEVKLALAEPDAAETFRNVCGWINVSGIYHGTPLITWLRSQWWRLPLIWLLFRLRGYSYSALWDLERRPGGLLDFDPPLPERMRVVHLVGFPQQRDLTTALARRGHRRLAPLGPNDGGPILLADVVRLPGHVYPVWGADHFLRPAHDPRLISRLLRFIMEAT
jgi:hypothetical protein